MKKKIQIQYDANRTEEREVNYIPVRYILALFLAVLETAAVITIDVKNLKLIFLKHFTSILENSAR